MGVCFLYQRWSTDFYRGMFRYLQIAATAIALTLGGSAAAVAQNTLTADNARTDVRTWGPEANGLAISIGVDKTTYVVGDAIPLHTAFRNIRTNETMTLPFCNRFELSVRNMKGEEFVDRYGDLGCDFSGPIRPNRPGIAPGEIVLSETNLAGFRLPPGTYIVSGQWTAFAYLKDPKSQTGLGASGTQPFYVHSNPVTIRIVTALMLCTFLTPWVEARGAQRRAVIKTPRPPCLCGE
jgi:hypothetical protein